MNKKLSTVFVILFLAMGCSTLKTAEVREGAEGKAIPVITQSFASKEVSGGDTWKIYLNASDPDGGLESIFAVVDQTDVEEYPVSIIRIPGQNPKELSGYIYLDTWNPDETLDLITLKLTVQIQDKAGNFSAPMVFPLFIQGRATQEAPPEGVFKEQALGPIMVTLHSVLGPGDGGH
jgi:hypothetical protein